MNKPSEAADHFHSLDRLEAQILTLVQEVQAKIAAVESSPNSSIRAAFDEIELSIRVQFFNLKTLLPVPQIASGFIGHSAIALSTIALSKTCRCQRHQTNGDRAIYIIDRHCEYLDTDFVTYSDFQCVDHARSFNSCACFPK